jgi:hypothetical protein
MISTLLQLAIEPHGCPLNAYGTVSHVVKYHDFRAASLVALSKMRKAIAERELGIKPEAGK